MEENVWAVGSKSNRSALVSEGLKFEPLLIDQFDIKNHQVMRFEFR